MYYVGTFQNKSYKTLTQIVKNYTLRAKYNIKYSNYTLCSTLQHGKKNVFSAYGKMQCVRCPAGVCSYSCYNSAIYHVIVKYK